MEPDPPSWLEQIMLAASMICFAPSVEEYLIPSFAARQNSYTNEVSNAAVAY
jgi:hypothetical protein